MGLFSDTDSEDVGDLFENIQLSYGFTFKPDELGKVKTFGDLCDLVIRGSDCTHVNDCTSQQAFYKVRKILVNALNVEKDKITPSTTLQVLTGSSVNIATFYYLDQQLADPTAKFRSYAWQMKLHRIFLFATVILAIALKNMYGAIFVSVVAVGLLLRLIDIWNLSRQTIGQMAQRLSIKRYKLMRSDPGTINKDEVIDNLKFMIIDSLCLDISHDKINKDTIL
jgi:acyl carrier protein